MTKNQEENSVSGRRKKLLQKKAAENASNLSIAERLTRRAKQQTTSVTMEDDLGDFVLELRQPTRRELDDLLKFQQEIQKPDKQDEASDKLYILLGELCIDESLSREYWKNGDYSLSDLMDIISKLFDGFVQRFQEVQSFRADGHGAGTVPDVRVPGQAPP